MHPHHLRDYHYEIPIAHNSLCRRYWSGSALPRDLESNRRRQNGKHQRKICKTLWNLHYHFNDAYKLRVQAITIRIYMADKLSLFIELPVWWVTRTWSKSLYYVFEISILYHWLLAFVRKWSQIADCNQKVFLLHAWPWWAFASLVIRFHQ